jgi:hypothetical protein
MSSIVMEWYILKGRPMRTHREFFKNEQVLAWFPGTTAFYPAIVIAGPKKVSYSAPHLRFLLWPTRCLHLMII